MGRFINEDPIRFAGGDGNFYRFVQNNPVNFVDPFGFAVMEVPEGFDKEDFEDFDPSDFINPIGATARTAVKLAKKATELIPGSLKKSKSFFCELADKTFKEILELAKGKRRCCK